MVFESSTERDGQVLFYTCDVVHVQDYNLVQGMSSPGVQFRPIKRGADRKRSRLTGNYCITWYNLYYRSLYLNILCTLGAFLDPQVGAVLSNLPVIYRHVGLLSSNLLQFLLLLYLGPAPVTVTLVNLNCKYPILSI